MIGDGRYSYMIFNSDESQYYTTLVYDANTHGIEIQTSDMSWTSGVTLYLSKNSKEVIASAYIENTMCTMYAAFNMDEINYNDKFIADADLSNDSAYTDSQAKELCTALVHMALLEYDLGQADYSVGVSLTDLGFVTYYNDTNPDDNVGQNTTPPVYVPEITVPETTVPETTVPETTVPETTTEPFVEPEIIITDKPGVSADSVDGLVIGYMGDNDANGNVNIKDASNIQKYNAKLISFSTKQSALSDVDQSGEVNIRDATTIQKHLAGFGVVSKIECLMYETGNHVHNHIEIVVEPGCLAKGYTNHSCICGDEYHTNETNAVGHKYVASVTKPTCTEKGYTTHQCSRCRDTYKDTYTNATGHSYSSKVTKPTCVDDGYTTYTCKNCKDTYTGDYKSATGEHNFNSSGKCKTCGYKKPASSSAFDKLANYIKKYGSLTDDGEEYIYSLYMSDYEQFATLFYNLDDGTIDLFLVATDDYGNVSTTMNISLTKGSSYFDYACLDEKFLMTGSLKMSSITYDMPSIDYEDIYYYESASEAYVAGITISMLDLSLLHYMLYDETYGLPVSIQELGFTNYYVN